MSEVTNWKQAKGKSKGLAHAQRSTNFLTSCSTIQFSYFSTSYVVRTVRTGGLSIKYSKYIENILIDIAFPNNVSELYLLVQIFVPYMYLLYHMCVCCTMCVLLFFL